MKLSLIHIFPNVNTQTLKTTVRVPSGSTIVLGGLISDDKQLTKSGIPYISKIPILGALLGGCLLYTSRCV